MAVYTHVSSEAIEALLARYDAGSLVSAKDIAEGVENSNFLIETTTGRFVLTLYEKRVAAADLPFFLAMIDHLAERGQPVPQAIRDREGIQIQHVAGRPACLMAFLPGVTPDDPGPPHARLIGEALGQLHRALANFELERNNTLGLAGWRALADLCGDGLGAIADGLDQRVAAELDFLDANWPDPLPRSAIHADLFPDNALMLDGRLTGIIDFYFACTDLRAYDLAITHAAWCFGREGKSFDRERSQALIAGYDAAFGISDDERAALPVLGRGASLRFLLTRAWDWLETPTDALVTRKDPIEFVHRLDFYRESTPADFVAA